MKSTLLFASQNKKKVEELQSTLSDEFQILSLNDVGFTGELDEPFDTFEANAKHKALQGFSIFNLPCFAEDSGLVIEALDGRPGVLSARYAGKNKDIQANIDKVLSEMENKTNRQAFFIAVIAYFDGVHYQQFTGKINGSILLRRHGMHGFGYDPIFQPDGYSTSFGELPQSVKDSISHRSIAVRQLVNWLMKIK